MDSLGDRMKEFYENRTRYMLSRRTFTILRIDGKAFHSYTKGLKRPFDDQLMKDMDETAKFLCKEIQGTKLAYIQSDEISLILTDFDDRGTDAWFDGNIQKMISVSASLATAKFNELRPGKLAFFDSRVFTIPYQGEVENYLIWRQNDASRNSVSAVAQSLYSHKELSRKTCDQMQEMIFQKGINWNDYAPWYKRGRMAIKEYYEKNGAQRPQWVIIDIPIFSKDKEFLNKFLSITI
jgi:tRNA(His) guanylyltransferase